MKTSLNILFLFFYFFGADLTINVKAINQQEKPYIKIHRTFQSPLDTSTEFEYETRDPSMLVRYDGFQFCPQLNGAYFDVGVPLKVSMIEEAEAQLSPEEMHYYRIRSSKQTLKWDDTAFDPFTSENDEISFAGQTASRRRKPSSQIMVDSTTAREVDNSLITATIDFLAKKILDESLKVKASYSKGRKMTATEYFQSKSEEEKSEYSVHRMACFMAADGNNERIKFVVSRNK
jgi:hypothetical protein